MAAEQQDQAYVVYLSQVKDNETRKQCLARATEASRVCCTVPPTAWQLKFDAGELALRTAMNICIDADAAHSASTLVESKLFVSKGLLVPFQVIMVASSALDVEKLSAVDWLMMDVSQIPDALALSNYLLRYFLGASSAVSRDFSLPEP